MEQSRKKLASADYFLGADCFLRNAGNTIKRESACITDGNQHDHHAFPSMKALQGKDLDAKVALHIIQSERHTRSFETRSSLSHTR